MRPIPGTATESDLLQLLEREKRLCELVGQTLVEKALGFWEAMIAMRLGALLLAYADKLHLGVVSGPDSTMRMKTGNVRLPDVAFISFERLPKSRDPIPALGPDLAVEIMSDSNSMQEIRQKLSEFFDSGTIIAWLVDPRSRTVTVYHAGDAATRVLNEQDHLDGEAVLPGLSISVAELFKNIPQ